MKYLKSKQSATRNQYKVNTLYSSTKWRNFRAAILAEQGGQCVACGNIYPDHMLHIDHITPIASGGSVWDIDNLQVLCKACHGEKTINEVLHNKQ
jgi:5-methylcytosine-specific restriction enzyme A